ncbi:MAG: DUF4440 domain-containing protein [Cyclobacteriaceae bacterium]
MKTSLSVLLLILVLSGCANQRVDQNTEAEKLMELSRNWALEAQSADNERILSNWAPDAMVMPPGQPSIKGHDAIRKMLEESSRIPGFEINWEPKEAFVSKSGDLGYVIAHNYINVTDSVGKTITTFHKAVEIWKRQEDGSWKNVVDIFNHDPTLTSIK